MCEYLRLEAATSSWELVEQGLVVLDKLRASKRVNQWIQSSCQFLSDKRNMAEQATESIRYTKADDLECEAHQVVALGQGFGIKYTSCQIRNADTCERVGLARVAANCG